MKKSILFLSMIGLFFVAGNASAETDFDRLCLDTSDVWIEPAEEDFDSYNEYFGFLTRRASWSRTVEVGGTDTYFQWLLARYYWDTVTFADRDYACYSHLTRG